MSLGKAIFFSALFFFGGRVLAASSSGSPPPATTQKKPVVEKPKKGFISALELGVGYQMWNESMQISKGGNSSNGIANYAGLALLLEKNWLRYRWQYGAQLGYAAGKASSGSFTGLSYADGVNRAWSVEQLTIYGCYRLNSSFMAGLGLFTRTIQTDWKSSQDPALTIHPAPSFDVTGQLLLRWNFNRKFTLTQSFIPLDFNNSTMWQWTAQIFL
jgi:hypothetical protein